LEGVDLIAIKELRSCFQEVTDFRKPQGLRYNLADLLAVSILATLSGANDFTAMSVYCKEKWGFLQQHFKFHKIPSHDLFRTIYAFISPQQFYGCFIRWTNILSKLYPDELIAIDGKALRATREGDKNTSATYIVSAWAFENGLCLGGEKVNKKSNEKQPFHPY